MWDHDTVRHERKVAELAPSIGKMMKLPDDDIESLYFAGLLHDIGKITVPTEILSKPGKINDAEFGIIKNHPQAGYEILKEIEFPWPVAEIVFQSHERINGSGYPRGLSGKDTLQNTKILAVADVVEAMASHRPYRPAYEIETALAEILQNKGILYDTEVVDTALALFLKKRV